MTQDISAQKPPLTDTARRWVIAAALMALFLGAMDALIMSAAMPTIITELGGLEVYAWIYSAYFLARAVSLPIFGKLADLYPTRALFLVSIAVFLAASIFAGAAWNMGALIFARVIQGIGAGGTFALVYIALADVAPEGKRAKTLSMASSIWGIASVLGPTLGGFIVTWFSWRWIFFINVPVSLVSMFLIARYLVEVRSKKERVHLDFAGVVSLSVAVLGLLTLIMVGGREIAWTSLPALLLGAITIVASGSFYFAEKRSPEPILAIEFFRLRGFSVGNACVFLSSFSIFSLFAYAPLFIQGALGKTPIQVGTAMLSLSLGWSLGSLVLGQVLHHLGQRKAAIMGGIFLTAGALLTLTFTHTTTMFTCFLVFQLSGIGMGFVTLSTLLAVQGCIAAADLGVATTSHQFARTLGGTVGVGVCGGLATSRILKAVSAGLSPAGASGLPPDTAALIREGVEHLFQPSFVAGLDPGTAVQLQQAVGSGIRVVFWIVLAASVLCTLAACCLPSDSGRPSPPSG